MLCRWKIFSYRAIPDLLCHFSQSVDFMQVRQEVTKASVGSHSSLSSAVLLAGCLKCSVRAQCWQQELCFSPGRRMGAAAAGPALGTLSSGLSKPPTAHQTDLPRFIPCATERKHCPCTIPSYSVLSHSRNGASPCASCCRKARAHFSKSSRSRTVWECSCCPGC